MSNTKNSQTKILFGILACTMFYANAAMATNYECNTNQALEWKKGHLVSDKNRFSWAHAIIQFNDENGDFWIMMNKDSSPNPLPLKVVQKMIPGDELFAVYEGKDSDAAYASSIRIRAWDKETGMVFIFFSTPTNEIITGKCHIYKGDIPPVKHNQ